MKRLLVFFFIFCAALLIAAYFILPADNSFSKKVYIKTTVNAADRFFFNENNWIKWWPVDLQNNLTLNNKKDNGNNYLYSLKKKMYSSINIGIKKNETEFNTIANLFRINKDSITITWDFQIEQSKNPVTKIMNYFYAKTLKKNSIKILEHLKSFLEKDENIYGLTIRQIMVTDTSLIAKRYTSLTYPSTEIIYGLIQQLKTYVSKNNAIQTDSPMLHIKYDSGYYKTMVALPVNKELNGNDSILLKRMFPGKILVTQITGGTYSTRNAFRQLDIYIDDYHLSSPAIPFESLVTNRIEQPDTSKWITKIYYPIF